MLDPSRYALNAETVGFRKRMKLAVPMDSFSKALQTQSESVKVRREIQETPITEVHIMGGQMYGFQGNDKLITLERQQRQINGYPLRSFRVNSGPIFLPAKFGEGYQATPTMMGRVAYTSNATEGNYISKMTEPDPDHISTWNPVQKRKMLMGLEEKYSLMQKNVADWQEKRGFVNQITKQESGQRLANQIRANKRDPEATQSLEMALTSADINRLGRDPRIMNVAAERARLLANNLNMRNTTTYTSNVENNQRIINRVQVNLPAGAIESEIVRRAKSNKRAKKADRQKQINQLESAKAFLGNVERGRIKVVESERIREAVTLLLNNSEQFDLDFIEYRIEEFTKYIQEKNPNIRIVTNALPDAPPNDITVNVRDDLADELKRADAATQGDPAAISKEGGAVVNPTGPGLGENQIVNAPDEQPGEEVYVSPEADYGDVATLEVDNRAAPEIQAQKATLLADIQNEIVSLKAERDAFLAAGYSRSSSDIRNLNNLIKEEELKLTQILNL